MEIQSGTQVKTQGNQTVSPITVTPLKPCVHGRLVGEVLRRGGKKSGQVRCLECGAKFPDPSPRIK